jgi:hypothetical protein
MTAAAPGNLPIIAGIVIAPSARIKRWSVKHRSFGLFNSSPG